MISLKMNPHIYHNIHKHKYKAPLHPLEVNLLFFWGYYKYFNVSWLQPNPLQLLAAILYHPCHKFHCHSSLCFDFYYAQSQTQPSGAVQVLHPCLSTAAGTSAPNRSLSFTPCAMAVPGSCLWRRAVLPRSSLCCQQFLQPKQRQLSPGDQKAASFREAGGVRCQLPSISLQQDCLWALKLSHGFPAPRELSALSPPHRSQGHLLGVLWGSSPTDSDSISILSGGA